MVAKFLMLLVMSCCNMTLLLHSGPNVLYGMAEAQGQKDGSSSPTWMLTYIFFKLMRVN
jgi:hypothetical protein